MKHSNWILGIGILVAILLIAGTFLFRTDAKAADNGAVVLNPITAIKDTTKKIILKPVKDISSRFLQLNK